MKTRCERCFVCTHGPMSAEFDVMTALELRRRIIRKDVSPVELAERALDRTQASQPTLNVLSPESALGSAKAAEDAVMRGEPFGPLHGLPFSAKDLIAVAGLPYASGSRAMVNNIAAVDAPAVERMKAAGAILIGKTTTSEFGCKAVGDSPLTRITRHPWNLDKTPGGSSAGAAASVAAGITPFALGTGGGGSVRIPCCRRSPPPHRDRRLRSARSIQSIRHNAGLARRLPRQRAALRIAYSPSLGYARPDSEIVAIVASAARTFEELGCSVELVDRVFDKDPADIWTTEFCVGSARGYVRPSIRSEIFLIPQS
jgi:aspartyl-tRNA(Asn)/glutamyl-tRNA(Gln) amidotransferase subunit A